MEQSKTVLIVDDDANILQVAGFAVKKAGYEVVFARDGREALSVFAEVKPDLIVLDVMMPEMDGTEVCKIIRSQSQVPIIFLSSRDDEIDRIIGLELGGDDYVTKPFSPRELAARIKALFRRMEGLAGGGRHSSSPQPAGRKTMECGCIKLDSDRFQVFWKDQEIVLTATEFAILRTLLAYPGKVYNREELMAKAYDIHTVVSDRTIDSHIRHIREKFKAKGGDPIETIHGLGYKIVSSPAVQP